MATVYKVEITSHWMNYPKEDIKKMLEKALKEKGNEITIKIENR